MTTHDDNKPTNIITFDYDAYARYLEDADLTEDQKREFLEALWNIICEFVALGFGVHPLQQVLEKPCGESTESSGNPSAEALYMLECDHPDLVDLFKVADGGNPVEAGKDSIK